MFRNVAYFILLMSCNLDLSSQDVHFSQFYEQTSLVNPALTGIKDPTKVTIGYKDQWRSVTTPYKTLGASFESRIRTREDNKKKEDDLGHFAVGGSLFYDNAGDGNMSRLQGILSLASFVRLNTNNVLSMGLQASLIQRQINSSQLIFPNQYTGSTYNSSLASGEAFTSQSFVYGDFSGGFVWNYTKLNSKISGDKKTVANVGVSVFHLNKPPQRYLLMNNESVNFKYVFYGDFLFRISGSSIGLAPAYLVQLQGSSKEILAGLRMKHFLEDNSRYTNLIKRSCFGYGVFYRNRDAIMANFSYNHHEKYEIGLNYDVNISKLVSASKTRGGLEIVLKYIPQRIDPKDPGK